MPLTLLLVVAMVIGYQQQWWVWRQSGAEPALRGAAAAEGHAPPGLIRSAGGLRRARV